MSDRQKELGQYPTPAWVSEAIVERHFSDLDDSDLVLEPACGSGSFLAALPKHVPAIGVEIDAQLANEARVNTGRKILTGDFTSVPINFKPTAIIGNPPFSTGLVTKFLDRAHALLPAGGRVGFLLSTKILQTANTIAQMADHWSMYQEMLPRNIYEGLEHPMSFVIFSKDARRIMVGFALYREVADLQNMQAQWKSDVAHSPMPVWETAVARALAALGGEASLQQIYSYLERNKPTRTEHWRAKVRQTVRRYAKTFTAIGEGVYRLANTTHTGPFQMALA